MTYTPTKDVQEVGDLIWKSSLEATKDIMHEGVSTPMPTTTDIPTELIGRCKRC